MYPEFQLPEDQKKAWLADRTGAIVGVDTAKRFGWKVGDRVPLISPIYRKPDGSPWEFTIDGIYDSDEAGRRQDAVLLPLRLHQRDAARRQGAAQRHQVGWYIVPGRRSGDVRSARQADRRDVRQLAGRNQDRDRKGVHRRIGPSRSATSAAIMIAIAAVVMVFILFVAGQRHGPVDSRAHQRARRAEDARLRRRPDPRARAARVAARSRSSAAGSGLLAGLADHRRRAIRPAGCCRSSTSRRAT